MCGYVDIREGRHQTQQLNCITQILSATGVTGTKKGASLEQRERVKFEERNRMFDSHVFLDHCRRVFCGA